MRLFDVQAIEIRALSGKVFKFLRNPGNLPHWAHAFASVEDGRARLETPVVRQSTSHAVWPERSTFHTTDRPARACTSTSSSIVRHETKWLTALEPVDRKVRPVRREHGRAIELLGQRDQGGVRKVHRKIGVLVEQLPDALQRCRGRGNEKGPPGQKEIDAGGASAPNAGQEVSGFGQHRFGRHHRTRPVGEGPTAFPVLRLTAIEERDQGAGIEQQFTGHASTRR